MCILKIVNVGLYIQQGTNSAKRRIWILKTRYNSNVRATAMNKTKYLERKYV